MIRIMILLRKGNLCFEFSGDIEIRRLSIWLDKKLEGGQNRRNDVLKEA